MSNTPKPAWFDDIPRPGSEKIAAVTQSSVAALGKERDMIIFETVDRAVETAHEELFNAVRDAALANGGIPKRDIAWANQEWQDQQDYHRDAAGVVADTVLRLQDRGMPIARGHSRGILRMVKDAASAYDAARAAKRQARIDARCHVPALFPEPEPWEAFSARPDSHYQERRIMRSAACAERAYRAGYCDPHKLMEDITDHQMMNTMTPSSRYAREHNWQAMEARRTANAAQDALATHYLDPGWVARLWDIDDDVKCTVVGACRNALLDVAA